MNNTINKPLKRAISMYAKQLLPLLCLILVCGCQKEDLQRPSYVDPYGNEIEMPFDELCQLVAEQDFQNLSEEDIAGWTDEVLSEQSPITEDDYKLSNGLTFDEWLMLNDPTYKVGSTKGDFNKVPIIGKYQLTKAGGQTIYYPASYYKEMFISRFMSELIFLCNDEGRANRTVRATISSNNQEGLWYRWGGKIWDEFNYPSPGGYSNEEVKIKFYGLDCSGYLYQCLSNTGFPIQVKNCEGYQNLELWQSWLKKWLEDEKVDPAISSNLAFEKFSVSREELCATVQQGDIILCRNLAGKTQHVVMGTNGGEFFQSCGTTKVTTVEEYYKSKSGYRGPKKTGLSGIAKTYVKFDIIRLCVKDAEISTKDKINAYIKNSGTTLFTCSFPQPADLSRDETFAYDYLVNGSEFLIYAAGWDSILQNIFYIWFIYDRETYDISSVYYVLATIDEIKSGVTHEFAYKGKMYQICLKI